MEPQSHHSGEFEQLRRRLWGGALFWGLCVCAMSCALLIWFARGIDVESDIMAILPHGERNPVSEKLIEEFISRINRRIIILAGHSDKSRAIRAATMVSQRLVDSKLVEPAADSFNLRELYEKLFPYRYQLLSPLIRDQLAGTTVSPFIADAVRLLYSPISSAFLRTIDQDPLLVFPRVLKALPSPGGAVTQEDGVVLVDATDEADSRWYAVIVAQLSCAPFSPECQDEVGGSLTAIKEELTAEDARLRLIESGSYRFGRAARESMKRQISLSGYWATAGQVVVILLTFGSLLALVISLVPLTVGILTAIVGSLLIFPKLHLFTLVFGTTLIGVCVDFGFHFMAHHLMAGPRWNSVATVRVMFWGLFLGAFTTVLGYAGFMITPFPGLQQMAAFSSLGVIGALFTVVFWFPFLFKQPVATASQPIIGALSARYMVWVTRCISHRGSRWALGLLLICAAASLSRLEFNDDVRSFQKMPPELLQEDSEIRRRLGQMGTGTFVLVQGKDSEEVRERMELVGRQLQPHIGGSGNADYQSFARLIPSKERQDENRELLKGSLEKFSAEYQQYFSDNGFPDQTFEKFRASVNAPIDSYLDLRVAQTGVLSSLVNTFWLDLSGQGGVGAVIPLTGTWSEEVLEMALQDQEGVLLVNRVADISEIFARYRETALVIVIVAYLIIGALLIYHFGIAGGLIITAIPVCATVMTVGLLCALGQALNIIHLLALLIIMGMGIDFSIFFAESELLLSRGEAQDSYHSATLLAVTLSAMTAILSFGLLGITDIPVLRGLGLTVSLGILFSFLLSPLACRRPRVGGRIPGEF